MEKIIKKLKQSGFEWLASGRFAIDNLLGEDLKNIDSFSIIISENDKANCEELIKSFKIKNVNALIYSNSAHIKYLELHGIKTVISEEILSEISPRYFNNNKSRIREKILTYKDKVKSKVF
ncbi:MAG: hypothetical protein PHT91_00195 [Candidatus Nanoarchaeia archaeon]|nr:hypothetical protein [Candidatus Nanoarchaeia archaeon]MDD5499280.1 hypothetical protein [Candidatus Nanoarchaeia archaeon]